VRITDQEFAARREQFAARLEERGLSGAVLFDARYCLYYTGFEFIPTERPIAFVLATDGRGGMLVPRLEVEHARANTGVEEVAHYDEYPGEEHPMEALRELLDALGVTGQLGADADGYPWIFGYRGPGLGEYTQIADLVEDQMMIKSAAEIELLRTRSSSGTPDRG
jgi:Xaa-Pro aminopeptidase